MTMWDEVPDLGVQVPTGAYVVDVEDIEKGQTRETSKLMYSPVLRVVEPAEWAESPIYDNFTIGSNDDPLAQNDDTWKASVGARRFKQLIKAAQVQLDGNVDSNAVMEDQADQTAEILKGQRVVVSVELQTQPEKNDDGTPNRFAGRKQSRITGYYPLGLKEPGVSPEPAQQSAIARAPMPRPAAPRTAPMRPAPVARTAPPAAPAAPGRPTARLAPRGAPAARPAPAKAPPPPARPGPKPAAAKMAPAASAAKAPGRAPKVQWIECRECVNAGADRTQPYDPNAEYPNGALISRTDFPAHVDSHGEE